MTSALSIAITGIPIDRGLDTRVRRELRRLERRSLHGPIVAQVTFFDENGPKGGCDIRCALTVRLPRRRAMRIEHVGETARQAADGALDALARRLAEATSRSRTLRRRPKKYFAAARLLATDAAP